MANQQLPILAGHDVKGYTGQKVSRCLQALLVLAKCGMTSCGNKTHARALKTVLNGPMQKLANKFNPTGDDEIAMKELFTAAAELDWEEGDTQPQASVFIKAIHDFESWPNTDLVGRDECIAELGLEDNEKFAPPAAPAVPAGKRRKGSDAENGAKGATITELRAYGTALDAQAEVMIRAIDATRDNEHATSQAASTALQAIFAQTKAIAEIIHSDAMDVVNRHLDSAAPAPGS